VSSVGIAELFPLGAAPASGDLLVVVDVSDTTQSLAGSTKNMTIANLFAGPTFTGTTTFEVVSTTRIEEQATNGVTAVNINNVGYQGGTTQFRNLNVYDGKNNLVIQVVGSTKAVTLAGTLFMAGANANSVAAGEVALANAKYLWGSNAAGTVNRQLIGLNASDKVAIDVAAVGTVVGGTMSVASTLTLTDIVELSAAATARTGSIIGLGGTTQTTIGANGAASALTANPLGYLIAFKGSTKIVIPYYNG
jgi:hypothetical protein